MKEAKFKEGQPIRDKKGTKTGIIEKTLLHYYRVRVPWVRGTTYTTLMSQEEVEKCYCLDESYIIDQVLKKYS